MAGTSRLGLYGGPRLPYVGFTPRFGPDITTGVEFDGANDYLFRGESLTGISDGREGIASFWFSGTANSNRVIANSTNRLLVGIDADGNPFVIGRNSANTTILFAETTGDYTDGSWHHVAMSWNLASTTVHIYVDGAADENITTATNDDIDYTSSDWAVGASTAGGLKFTGCLGEPYFTNEYLDLDTAANRQKFYNPATGAPISLGSDGSTPTGTQPLIYLSGPASAWDTNFGSGGHFTIAGALEDCAIGTFDVAAGTVGILRQQTNAITRGFSGVAASHLDGVIAA